MYKSDGYHLEDQFDANHCTGVRNRKVAEKSGQRAFVVSKLTKAIPGAMR